MQMTTPVRECVRGLARCATERTGAVIALVGAGMLLAHLVALVVLPKPDGRVIFGDATHHFVQLRSIVFDRDLEFRNEYVRIYGLRGGEPGTEWLFTDLTPTGHVRNYTSIGPAILWAPLYLLFAGLQILLAAFGLAAWPDGFDRILQIAPGVTGVVAATLGVWLSWRLARRYTDASSAAAGTLAVWLGSSALYYSLVSPAYSHAASMLVGSMFFLHWLTRRGERTIGRFAQWGALVALASLMRWQDAIFLAVPLIEAVTWPVHWRDRFAALGAAGLAWLVVFSPQMIVWYVLYGRPLAVPQGASFLQWTSPHPIAVLFSDNHGLFTWTPLLLLSVVGLARFCARNRSLALPLAVVLLASWYVNAAAADWWAGEAFGARRFLSLFPLFALGLAAWLQSSGQWRRGRAVWLTVVWVLVGANFLLLLQYQLCLKGLAAIAPYPRGGFDMWVARFAVPLRLLAWWSP